jgi:hypothetical protein
MTVLDVIVAHGHFAHGGDPQSTAEAWEEAGFDAAEVQEWLLARCFTPAAARDLADAGVTAEMARMPTSAGAGDYTDAIGFKVADGDLSAEEARDIVGAA